MSYRIVFRRGTDSEWTAANPVLAYGEVGFESGVWPQIKVGDGVTPWTDLPYTGAGIGLPTGGVGRAVITKKSGDNYDTEWISRENFAGSDEFKSMYHRKVSIDIRDFGAKVDGVTDDTLEFQAAVDAAAAAGGGVVSLPPGIVLVSASIILKTKVIIRGAGVGVTTVKLSNNANCAVFQTFDFNALNPGATVAGPYAFGLEHFDIDANRDNNITSFGLRSYGYGYYLSDLRISNCVNNGIYSKWATSTAAITPHDMSAMISNVHVHDCLGDGIAWNGPHSSTFLNVHSYRNSRGFFNDSNGTNTRFIGCSAYGIGQSWGFYIGANGSSLVACSTLSAGTNATTGGQVFVGANDVSITGGHFNANGAGTTPNSVRGIVLGGVASASYYNINTKVTNCNSGSIAYDNDGGGIISGSIVQTSGSVYTGTANPLSKLNVIVTGGATYQPLDIPTSVNRVTSAGTAQTLPSVATAQISDLTLNSASCALTFPASVEGSSFRLILRQGTGNNNVTWPTVRWPFDITPTLSTTVGAVDELSFLFIAGQWRGSLDGSYSS